MVEVRRIRPEEDIQAQKICTVVFNSRHDYTGGVREQYPGVPKRPVDWTWGTFEDGVMTSTLIENKYLMRFDGNSVVMTGIGAVGTMPEARRGGRVREIFNKMLAEEYETGVMFSNLNPFSHAFYKRFGYELCSCQRQVRIPTKEFERRKMVGEFKPFMPGDDTQVLQDIYAQYIPDLNHACHRDYWPDNRAWLEHTNADPYASGSFLYIWHDDAGRPRSYIRYRHQRVGDENHMAVRELIFVDREALFGALSIVGGLSSQYGTFAWNMPTYLEPTDLVEDYWKVEAKISPRDMTRVVNVQAALTCMRRPEGEGSYVIEIIDPQVAANQGRWLVEYGPEGTRVERTQRDPDVICGIPAASQLITGYRTAENMLPTRSEGIEFCGNMDTLRKVFTLRPQHLTESF